MSEGYAILVRNSDQNTSDIEFWANLGYETYQLPDNQALMVAGDAPEEIKIAAYDAACGDYDAFKVALGMEPAPEEELSEEEFTRSLEGGGVKQESDNGLDRQPEGEAE
jgi:hypothetical protein